MKESSAQNDGRLDDGRLSRIETLWSVVHRAHTSNADVANDAQQELLNRYGGAIRRYLLGAVRNQDLADELFQEFAVKFIRGDFKTADPNRGKFRSFVKTVLFRLVALHFRRLKSQKVRTVDQLPEPSEYDVMECNDEKLLIKSWRDDVLNRTWSSLEAIETGGGPKYHTILKTRVSNPAADSVELAELISQVTEKTVTAGNARVQVHRAREKFAHLLIETIADSLEEATRESVESELIELQLIDYCRDVLNDFQGFNKKV